MTPSLASTSEWSQHLLCGFSSHLVGRFLEGSDVICNVRFILKEPYAAEPKFYFLNAGNIHVSSLKSFEQIRAAFKFKGPVPPYGASQAAFLFSYSGKAKMVSAFLRVSYFSTNT